MPMLSDARRVTPESIDELAETMRAADRDDAAMSFEGGATEFELGYPPERVHIVVATKRLDRVVEYAPDDMTVTVEAGVTLAALQTALAEHGQRLALDAPLPERATVAGLLATNGFGPRRARFGTLRDMLLGVCFVRAGGVVVRGGGKVVKNVAGFDVPKLLVGSLGTLGCVATATLRLHPLPEAEAEVTVRVPSVSALRAFSMELLSAQLEPSAVVALNRADGFDVMVLFEGFSAGIDQQTKTCVERAVALQLCAQHGGADASEFWSKHQQSRTSGQVRAKVTFAPSSLPELYEAALSMHARTFGDGAVTIYPTVGVAFCTASHADAALVEAALTSGRAVAERLGGSLTV
ncbi:MAG: FAD-binding oxidoreductase, partial [Candidatus Eremiobacteraeota bacterium]|nr:FAD-binding oxidoreductase [Candidatus Eremiobacteraeota bacterium]